MNSGTDYGIRSEIGCKLKKRNQNIPPSNNSFQFYNINHYEQIRAKMINNLLEFLMSSTVILSEVIHISTKTDISGSHEINLILSVINLSLWYYNFHYSINLLEG